MKLIELIELANKGYPDEAIIRAFDPETGKTIKGEVGDTLAEFVVTELRETFDPSLSEETQREIAARALLNASYELEGAANAIRKG